MYIYIYKHIYKLYIYVHICTCVSKYLRDDFCLSSIFHLHRRSPSKPGAQFHQAVHGMIFRSSWGSVIVVNPIIPQITIFLWAIYNYIAVNHSQLVGFLLA